MLEVGERARSRIPLGAKWGHRRLGAPGGDRVERRRTPQIQRGIRRAGQPRDRFGGETRGAKRADAGEFASLWVVAAPPAFGRLPKTPGLVYGPSRRVA